MRAWQGVVNFVKPARVLVTLFVAVSVDGLSQAVLSCHGDGSGVRRSARSGQLNPRLEIGMLGPQLVKMVVVVVVVVVVTVSVFVQSHKFGPARSDRGPWLSDRNGFRCLPGMAGFGTDC